MPQLIHTVAHVAFEVDDLDKAILNKTMLVPSKALANERRMAFIVEGGLQSSSWRRTIGSPKVQGPK